MIHAVSRCKPQSTPRLDTPGHSAHTPLTRGASRIASRITPLTRDTHEGTPWTLRAHAFDARGGGGGGGGPTVTLSPHGALPLYFFAPSPRQRALPRWVAAGGAPPPPPPPPERHQSVIYSKYTAVLQYNGD